MLFHFLVAVCDLLLDDIKQAEVLLEGEEVLRPIVSREGASDVVLRCLAPGIPVTGQLVWISFTGNCLLYTSPSPRD